MPEKGEEKELPPVSAWAIKLAYAFCVPPEMMRTPFDELPEPLKKCVIDKAIELQRKMTPTYPYLGATRMGMFGIKRFRPIKVEIDGVDYDVPGYVIADIMREEAKRECRWEDLTIDEKVEILRSIPWSRSWAEGICKMMYKTGRDIERCVNTMLRRLAESI